jgi:acyl-CoA thioester hydrolase
VADGFRYVRRVQFAETDLAGIVHFSMYFRYMEEAEHALWRAAGLTIARAGEETGWPRVSATFEFRNPLHFEDEFDVTVRLDAQTRRTLRYAFTIARGETAIGAGTLTAARVSKRDGAMTSTDIPPEIIARLRAAGA